MTQSEQNAPANGSSQNADAQTSEDSDSSTSSKIISTLKPTGNKWPFIGGGVAMIVTLGVKFLIGGVYSQSQALRLIEALRDSSLYFGAAVATASATILALMLTLLGLSRRSETDFDVWVYKSINRIALISTISLCGAVLLLMVLSLPIGEFDKISEEWFIITYYVLVVFVSLLAGLVITAVLMLFNAIQYVIRLVTPGDEI